MMSCDAWIMQGVTRQQWFPSGVNCVYLVAYEPCGTLLSWLKKRWQHQGHPSTFLSASEMDGVDFEVLLGMSSLQPISIMVITMDIEPSRKLYTRIIEYCSTYQGPYQLILAVSSQQKLAVQRNPVIEIAKHVDFTLFSALYWLINGDTSEKNTIKQFFDYISRLTPKLTLAQACAVIPYMHVLGRGKEQFCREWLPSLLQAQTSLFTLSQNLLARDARAFYATWHSLRAHYPDEFWLVYWSDQFWQAYCFITAHRARDQEPSSSGPARQNRTSFDGAAPFTKGLPFSFIQRGWHGHQASLFAELVEHMYDYDCYAKQGGLMIPYELLFNRILTSKA